MKDIIKHIFDKTDIMQFITGFGLLISFMAIIAALITRAIPSENKEALIHVLGILEGIITTIVMFYYGSSKGSQKKDEAMKVKDKIIVAKEEQIVAKLPEDTPKQ
jgi:uncharacterized protein YacL